MPSSYEERITVWRAEDIDAAIAFAEREAREYVQLLGRGEYTGLAQAYNLAEPPGHGAEIFSLVRDSDLATSEYLNRYFDTGNERQAAAG